MTAILQTCAGSGRYLRAVFEPPPGLIINPEEKTWAFNKHSAQIGQARETKFPGPEQVMGVFYTDNEDHIRALVAATSAFTEQHCKS